MSSGDRNKLMVLTYVKVDGYSERWQTSAARAASEISNANQQDLFLLRLQCDVVLLWIFG